MLTEPLNFHVYVTDALSGSRDKPIHIDYDNTFNRGILFQRKAYWQGGGWWGYIEKRWRVFPRTTGPRVAGDSRCIRKYSEHQEIDGVERCNGLAGNGKLTLQCQSLDMRRKLSNLKVDSEEVPDPRLGLNDARIFQWPLKCGQCWTVLQCGQY